MADSQTNFIRLMAAYALAYCGRLYYLEEVEEIRIVGHRIDAGRTLHEAKVDTGGEWFYPTKAYEDDTDLALQVLQQSALGLPPLVEPPHFIAGVAAVLARLRAWASTLRAAIFDLSANDNCCSAACLFFTNPYNQIRRTRKLTASLPLRFRSLPLPIRHPSVARLGDIALGDARAKITSY